MTNNAKRTGAAIGVAGEKVVTQSDVLKRFDWAKSKGRRAVLLRVKSGDQDRFVALTLGKA